MERLEFVVDEQAPPPLGVAELSARLDEAEADEKAGRITDGAELVRDLRRKADELQNKIGRRRA